MVIVTTWKRRDGKHCLTHGGEEYVFASCEEAKAFLLGTFAEACRRDKEAT